MLRSAENAAAVVDMHAVHPILLAFRSIMTKHYGRNNLFILVIKPTKHALGQNNKLENDTIVYSYSRNGQQESVPLNDRVNKMTLQTTSQLIFDSFFSLQAGYSFL